jgi:protein-S-isoprenylcysteine O-methyltransferase Ste14
VTREHSTGNGAARSFAIAGGVLFVFSLAYTAWSYASPFGMIAIDSLSAGEPAAFDVLLFTGFALHHSVFARSAVRQWIASHVPARLERSVYVWVASLLLIVVVVLWRPVPGELWRLALPWSAVLSAVQVTGVLLTLRASAALDVFSLAGVRQAFGSDAPPHKGSVPAHEVGLTPLPAHELGLTPRERPHLVETGLYRVVRHPVYFGWVLMVWPTPVMTGTRLVFAAVSTLYLALAIPLEERSLRRQFGPAYSTYAAKVRWKMIPGIY